MGNPKQLVKEYWTFDGSIAEGIQYFLRCNDDYKLVSYQITFCDNQVGNYALVLYELKESEK